MDTDMYAEVLTHVGGFSLFQEFEQKSAYEVFTDCPLKDVLWYEELANCVVTRIGSSSLFLEQSMDTQYELDGWLEKPTRLKHGIDGVRVVFPAVLSEKCQQELLLREMQYASNVATFSLSWDPGGFSLQLMCHTTGGVNLVCLIMTTRKQKVQLSGEMQHEVAQCNLWFYLGRKSDAIAIQFAFHQNRNLRILLHHGRNSGICILPWGLGTQEDIIHPYALRKTGEGLTMSQKFGIETRRSMPCMHYQTSVDYDCYVQFGGYFTPGVRRLAMLCCGALINK
jgi:hypothetical protein